MNWDATLIHLVLWHSIGMGCERQAQMVHVHFFPSLKKEYDSTMYPIQGQQPRKEDR